MHVHITSKPVIEAPSTLGGQAYTLGDVIEVQGKILAKLTVSTLKLHMYNVKERTVEVEPQSKLEPKRLASAPNL